MKYYDKVRVIKDRKSYNQENIFAGEIGIIWLPEIRDDSFCVRFDTGDTWNAYKYGNIKIEDLALIEESKITDEQILNEIPKRNKNWWCKVQNGFIVNLNGDIKNKIPYDYNS